MSIVDRADRVCKTVPCLAVEVEVEVEVRSWAAANQIWRALSRGLVGGGGVADGLDCGEVAASFDQANAVQ